MSDSDPIGDEKVSGNQALIPSHVREAFDIDDGDTLRWHVVDGELRVTFISTSSEAFDDFEPGHSVESVDFVDNHDRAGG